MMGEFSDHGATLFLALYIPGASKADDPDDIADALALIINEERVRNGGVDAALDDDAGFDRPEVEHVIVAAIDFQVQHTERANADFDGRRHALGLRPTGNLTEDDQCPA